MWTASQHVNNRAVHVRKLSVPRQVGEDPLQQEEEVLVYGRAAYLDRGNWKLICQHYHVQQDTHGFSSLDITQDFQLNFDIYRMWQIYYCYLTPSHMSHGRTKKLWPCLWPRMRWTSDEGMRSLSNKKSHDMIPTLSQCIVNVILDYLYIMSIYF